MAINPVIRHTREEHTKIIGDYFPGGRIFGCKNDADANLYKLNYGVAETQRQLEDILFQLYAQYDFRTTENFIDEWEAAVGFPDDCFPVKSVIADRQRNVLAKWLAEGTQTADDFIELAALFGITAVITPGIEVTATFPLTFPVIFVDEFAFPYTFPLTFTEGANPRFQMYVQFTGADLEEFTYTFPMTLGSVEIGILECLFRKLAPANVQVIFV
jgi:uncharacterized protein YmfQ (DUF2313 family)